MVWVLLDEAALHRAVGGPRVMVEQIRHMVCLMEASRVRVHVMPYRIGAYPLLQSMLTLMSWTNNRSHTRRGSRWAGFAPLRLWSPDSRPSTILR
ncbi:Scr1 family TA system antitoxin-like transcriptional regulator [Embleya scabrispora]|uniref:Scr1 family TA system antitoxin-like transcriptional regulator n=1 Tax=Embleya scabrispora TaxID=159449 RepID=UPI001F31DD07|nr:Scr1 family TA system antitoxin-like transcriptional regulator [Embleya scabrispora]